MRTKQSALIDAPSINRNNHPPRSVDRLAPEYARCCLKVVGGKYVCIILVVKNGSVLHPALVSL